MKNRFFFTKSYFLQILLGLLARIKHFIFSKKKKKMKVVTLQTHHVDSTLKRRGDGRNPSGAFVGTYLKMEQILQIGNNSTNYFKLYPQVIPSLCYP